MLSPNRSQQLKAPDTACPGEVRLIDLVESGKTKDIRALLSSTTQSRDDLISALYRAIRRRNSEIAECLINGGASLGSTDFGYALGVATRIGNIEIVQHLLKVGAALEFDITIVDESLELCDMFVNTPLRAVLDAWRHHRPKEGEAPRQYVDIIKLLVEAGASVDSTSPDGLYCAVMVGNLDMIRYLVEHAEDRKSVLDADYFGYEDDLRMSLSALWAAVSTGRLDIVRYLVEAGANPLRQCTYHHVDEFAIHAALNPDHQITDSARLGMINYLISVDKDQLNKKTGEGKTCLHLAAEINNAECADWLIAQAPISRQRPMMAKHLGKAHENMGAGL
ncbi:ankyrin repeat-containing domain protein [Nemania abortiva]|nr:ankyrin repeat-containing domain protein [Nemania abortiva]